MAVSYTWATRWAQAAALFTLLGGTVALIREAGKLHRLPVERRDLVTTGKNTNEKAATPKGTASTEKQEVGTALNPSLTERVLGESGLWVVRVLLVLLVAFLVGALVQRTLLGKFAFKAGGIELPEVQAPPLAALPPSVTAGFQFDASFTTPPTLTSAPTLLGPGIISSSYATLVNKIKEERPADFVVIDLGEGRNWLTTRLFLFAILLRRMRAVEDLCVPGSSRGRREEIRGSPGSRRCALAPRPRLSLAGKSVR
jgi:hypothetical protein